MPLLRHVAAAPAIRVGRLNRAREMGREAVAGVVASLVPLTNYFTFAALIFSGPWTPMLSQGVATVLLGGAVTALVVALTSRFRMAVAGPISLTSVVLEAMLLRLAPEVAGQPQAVATATVLAALATVTLTTGLVLLLLGGFRLSRIVRFTPYPVIAGFMGATGWVMVAAAIRMATDQPLSFASLAGLAAPAEAVLVAELVGFTGVLFLLTRRWRHPLTVPLSLVAAAVAIHLGLYVSGLSLTEARAVRVLFDVAHPAALAVPLLSGGLRLADWHAVLFLAPSMVPVVVVGVVQALVTAPSLEVALDTEVDLDAELRVQGYANLAAGLAGGILGFTSSTYTSANQAAHGRGRLSACVVGIVMLAALAGGAAVMSLVPRIVLGGMLLLIGLELLWHWGVASRLSMPAYEWLLTLAIIVLTATLGFLAALLIGLIGSCLLLALSLMRLDVVRHSYGVHEAASAVQRSEAQMLVLAERGGEARVIELGGFLFFGSAHQLLARVKAMLASGAVGTLIIDFSAVSGIDSSTASVLGRIRSMAAKAGTRLILSGLPAEAALLMPPNGRAPVLRRATLDEAIEVAEERLLALPGATPDAASIEDWLAVALGDAKAAQALWGQLDIAAFEDGDVLCRQGEQADSLYFIGGGRVSVSVAATDGSAIRLRVFGPQTIAGELGFLLGTTRTATLQVERPALVGQLSREAFQRLSVAHPAAVVALLEYLARVQAERLSFATRQIVALRR